MAMLVLGDQGSFARGRRSRRWATTILVAALAVAASSGVGNASSTRKAAAVDKNGVLRYALDLAAAADVTFDPVQSLSQTNEPFLFMAYDSLLRLKPGGDFAPGLASSVEVVDPSTIEVKLRPNLRFTDGTPLDAAAARDSILAIRQSANARCCRPEYALLRDVQVVNPTTFRLLLEGTSAGAYFPLLAGTETMIVSSAARQAGKDLGKEPVGAGPFVLREQVEDQRLVFVKNPDHWDAKNVKLAGVEVLGITRGPNQQAALRSGQVDMIAISGNDVASLQPTFGIYEESDSNSTIQIPVCKSRAPLDDVRVRRALNYATDLDAINTAVMAGKGEKMEALFNRSSKLFPKSLDGLYDYNPKKAKKLLRAAGVEPGTELGMIIIAGHEASIRWSEILQQQWNEVGINLRIVPSSNVTEDFFVNAREPLMILPFSRGGVSKVSSRYGKAIGNVCGYEDVELNGLVQQLSSVAEDSEEGIQLWKEVQERIFRESLSLWGLFNPTIWAYDKDLAGIGIVSSTIAYPDVIGAYVKR